MNLTNEDLLTLEEVAKKATPGPWQANSCYIDSMDGYEVCQVIAHHPQNEEEQGYNRQYIAAANPAVVLALINKVRELEQKNLKLTEIDQNNYRSVTQCVEAAILDANRYRWLRQQHWNGSPLCVVYNPAEAVKLGHTCPSGALLDAAIDTAIDERMKENELKDI